MCSSSLVLAHVVSSLRLILPLEGSPLDFGPYSCGPSDHRFCNGHDPVVRKFAPRIGSVTHAQVGNRSSPQNLSSQKKGGPDTLYLIGKPGGGPTQFKGSRKGRRRWPRAVAARKKCASAACGGSKARRRQGGKWRRQQPSPCCSFHWGKHALRKKHV